MSVQSRWCREMAVDDSAVVRLPPLQRALAGAEADACKAAIFQALHTAAGGRSAQIAEAVYAEISRLRSCMGAITYTLISMAHVHSAPGPRHRPLWHGAGTTSGLLVPLSHDVRADWLSRICLPRPAR